MIYLLLGFIFIGVVFIYAENKLQSTHIAELRTHLDTQTLMLYNTLQDDMRTQFAELRELVESHSTDADSHLTPYELERLEREEQFDKRITQLKAELSRTHDYVKQGVTADELHPLVHNLPHHIIDNRVDDLPDVEIAE